MADLFFFDSYAFFELLKGNPNYAPYTTALVLTSKLNLFEVYYGLLRDTDTEAAETFLKQYFDIAIDFDEQVLRMAAHFRLQHRKKNLSMTDCIGYCLAQQWGVPFLTGDKEFEFVDGVEFVK